MKVVRMQDVIELIENSYYNLAESCEDVDSMIEDVEALPYEERPNGRWYMEHHTWFCDQCGKNPTKGMGYVQDTDELFAYCPHCGARMKGADDE